MPDVTTYNLVYRMRFKKQHWKKNKQGILLQLKSRWKISWTNTTRWKKKHETDNEDLFFFNTNDFPVDHEYNNDCIPLPSSVAEEDSFLV